MRFRVKGQEELEVVFSLEQDEDRVDLVARFPDGRKRYLATIRPYNSIILYGGSELPITTDEEDNPKVIYH